MYYTLNDNVYIVEGKAKSCIYDLNKSRLFSVNKTLADKLIQIQHYILNLHQNVMLFADTVIIIQGLTILLMKWCQIFLVMTNGDLLTEEMVKRFKKYQYHWFQVSIDGATARYHNWFRQIEGSWDKAVRGTKRS